MTQLKEPSGANSALTYGRWGFVRAEIGETSAVRVREMSARRDGEGAGGLRSPSQSHSMRLQCLAAVPPEHPLPSLFVGLQMSGASVVEDDGRSISLQAGDVVVVETGVPRSDDGEGICSRAGGVVTAMKVSSGHPVADLTEHYVHRLAGADLDARQGAAVQSPGLDILRAAISAYVEENADARDTLQASLLERIAVYVKENLSDPQLSATKIACAQHISVRYLYKLLAGEGISLTGWIRNQRLEECSRELSTPEAANITIETVAKKWGFVDMSNFSRVFKAAYGIPPREWRKRHGGSHA